MSTWIRSSPTFFMGNSVEQAGSMTIASNAPLLEVSDLQVQFATDSGIVRAVDGVSFQLRKGETLAVVGESGSGKSVTSLAIMGLLPRPGGRIAGGSICFDGKDLSLCSKAEMRLIRGTGIGMIFQEPMTSLNPVQTVGEQIAERVRVHTRLGERAAMAQAIEMLRLVKIPDPARRAQSYPHQMSGGMRQRVMIAMALACHPKLLIADEPTTALDVTIQAQILDLMRNLQSEFGMAILFITHDLGVVAEMADRVVVMYAGRAVEEAGVREIFARPRMPYTRALLRSIPRVDRAADHQQRLEAITGNVPNPRELPAGCAFHPRCRHTEACCIAQAPVLQDTGEGHMVRCCRWDQIYETATVTL
jgi:oligopeptide/dipeptide ABC transporter ATP-binding protein